MPVQTVQDAWQRCKERREDQARAVVIEHYSYLVKITAQRVVTNLPRNLEREDLHTVGAMGLIKAVDQFDPGRQVKFETYAIALIRGAILDSLREEDWAPRSVRERAKTLERTLAQMELTLGAPPTEEQLAGQLGISPDELARYRADAGRTNVLSLDDALPGGDENGGLRLGDMLTDDSVDLAQDIEIRECTGQLGSAMECLPERERLVIALYYYEGLTFKEVGKVLTVSETRVYQLHTQAVRRMRGHLAHDKDLFGH